MMWWFTGGRGEGGVSPGTLTTNWLHAEGVGGRGGQSLYVDRKGLQSRGEGGGICADTRLSQVEERMLGDIGFEILW